MSKLLMITGDRSLAQGKKGAFYNTLEEFHRFWDRVDIICPRTRGIKPQTTNKFEIQNSKPETRNQKPETSFFGNVFVHPSSWPLIFQPFWILYEGLRILRANNYEPKTPKRPVALGALLAKNYIMTVHEYPPFYNGIGGRLLWYKTKIPYVLEIHHVSGYPRAANLKEWLYKTTTRYFIKYDTAKTVAVRVVNQHQTPDFLIKAGVPADKIKYMPSAYIDLETFRPMLEIEKKYDLVFAARLEKNKGVLNLIEAIKIVKQSEPNIKLLIIGQGPELSRIKLETRNQKLETNIYFSGWLETLDDVARAYNSARIFVNPSLNEGGPRVVFEAMACGLPVITTKVGMMPDIIKDGENGLFVDWNSADMAENILFLLNNQELQEKFSQAGLELVKQFEKKSAIKNYAEQLHRS